MERETRQILIFGALILAAVFWLTYSRPVGAQAGLLTVVTPAQVTCDGSAHAFSATPLTAREISIVPAASGNSGPITTGDSGIGSSRGWPIAGGGSYEYPSIPIDAREAVSQHFYDLTQVYYYCGSGDTFRWGYVR